jgi:hypothetical protein
MGSQAEGCFHSALHLPSNGCSFVAFGKLILSLARFLVGLRSTLSWQTRTLSLEWSLRMRGGGCDAPPPATAKADESLSHCSIG